MKRAILLQVDDITGKKAEILKDFSLKATAEYNRLWKDRDFCNTFMDFHRKTFADSKKRTGFNVQVYACLERAVWRSKSEVKGVTVKFNVPRNCKTFATKFFDFVELGIYPRNRIAVPIKKNRNWQRYSDLIKGGWVCKTYGLTSRLDIVAYLSKDDVELLPKRNVLGVNVNSKCFAVSVISPEGKVLHQDYFGKDIWAKWKKLFERKSILQSYADTGSEQARKALKKTKRDEHNFVKNRVGEVVRDITEMALQYDADIAIENLRRFSAKGKRFNREVMRIPILLSKGTLSKGALTRILRFISSMRGIRVCSVPTVVLLGRDMTVETMPCSDAGNAGLKSIPTDMQARKLL